MTILFTCVWGGLLDSEEIEYRNINQVFFWNSSFLYNNTDVKDLNNEFSLEITYVDSAYDSIPPGRVHQFKRNVEADTVYFITTSNSSLAVA